METDEAELDPQVWSNISISDPALPRVEHTDAGGTFFSMAMRRLTWQEAYEREQELRRQAQQYAVLLSDLDRCEHGRHEGDDCSSCRGPSHGNPLLAVIADAAGRAPFAQLASTPRQIGFTMDARPIVVPGPERDVDRSPAGWVGERR